MNKRPIAVNTNTYHGFSLQEALENIAEIGYHNIELTATDGWTEHIHRTMSLHELVAIKQEIARLGLNVVGMSGHTNLMDPTRLGDFIDNMHLAHFFDSKYIVTSVGEAHLEDANHASDDQLRQNIQKVIPYLNLLDLQLTIEVHGDHGTGKRIQEIIDPLDNSRVGIAYDTANAIFYGEGDMYEDLESVVDDISYVHLKDKDGAKQEWNFPAIGKGTLDFKRIFELLDSSDRIIPISIEIEFTQAGPKDIDEVNQALRDSKDTLKKLGCDIHG